MDNINRIRKNIKNKKKEPKNSKKNWASFSYFFSKFLITIIVTLVTLILLKTNDKFRTIFYRKVYDENLSFTSINNWYQKTFGSQIPFSELLKKETKTVFNEKLEYTEQSKYLDGVKLKVTKNYLVPIIESGMVVFIGEKDGYGKTVIIQQMDGIDVWYGNINNTNLKLYDYVEKGNLLGEVKDTNLYLVFKKEGKILSYEKHL